MENKKKKQKRNKKIAALVAVECIVVVALIVMIIVWTKPGSALNSQQADTDVQETVEQTTTPEPTPESTPTSTPEPTPTATPTPTPEPTPEIPFNAYEEVTISWNPEWEYADYSEIHTSDVTLYRSLHEGRKVITINAGHGTQGGSSVKTLCHPDGTPKVTGGSTSEGATYATAIATGTTMLDGTPEAKVTLKLALIVRDRLLDAGFSVLMIREEEDTQLDNIARTVLANENSDCHIALHYDSTDYDKGFFYMRVPDVSSYKSMEPVASHWESHDALGESLLEGMRAVDFKIFSNGNIPMDLTQTSYSTVPSVDVEVGDRGSDYSEETLNKIADGILEGVKLYFNESYE